jgi:hypothetical protein
MHGKSFHILVQFPDLQVCPKSVTVIPTTNWTFYLTIFSTSLSSRVFALCENPTIYSGVKVHVQSIPIAGTMDPECYNYRNLSLEVETTRHQKINDFLEQKLRIGILYKTSDIVWVYIVYNVRIQLANNFAH